MDTFGLSAVLPVGQSASRAAQRALLKKSAILFNEDNKKTAA
jgi:hypothetical protein